LASLLLAVGVAVIPCDKRDKVSDVTIYAYGTNVSGLPLLAHSSGIDNTFALSLLLPKAQCYYAKHNN
jgi:hypothetical protein